MKKSIIVLCFIFALFISFSCNKWKEQKLPFGSPGDTVKLSNQLVKVRSTVAKPDTLILILYDSAYKYVYYGKVLYSENGDLYDNLSDMATPGLQVNIKVKLDDPEYGMKIVGTF